jgi:hypothetical protein
MFRRRSASMCAEPMKPPPMTAAPISVFDLMAATIRLAQRA